MLSSETAFDIMSEPGSEASSSTSPKLRRSLSARQLPRLHHRTAVLMVGVMIHHGDDCLVAALGLIRSNGQGVN